MVNIPRKYLKLIDAPLWIRVARTIKITRKWKKLTKEDLASKANIDIKRYKRIERELVKDITIVEIGNIADAMNLNIDDIIWNI